VDTELGGIAYQECNSRNPPAQIITLWNCDGSRCRVLDKVSEMANEGDWDDLIFLIFPSLFSPSFIWYSDILIYYFPSSFYFIYINLGV